MRLAVISDLHGNLVALETMLADLDAAGGADTVWCLGDIAAFGPRPTECIRLLRDLREQYGKDNFKIIGGNTDRYLVTGEHYPMPPARDADALKKLIKSRKDINTILDWNAEQLDFEDYEFLAKILRKELSLKVDGYGWVIGYHAIPGDDEPMLREDTPEEEALDALLDREGRLAIGGHIHVQMDRDLENWRLLNVGSVGSSKSAPGHTQWALLSFADGDVEVDFRSAPFDVDMAIAGLNAVGYPIPEFITKTWQSG